MSRSEKKWNEQYKASDWKQLESDDYKLDREARRFNLKIEPHTVVQLTQVGDYAFSAEGNFPVARVGLRDDHGGLMMEGIQPKNHFLKDPKHAIYYRNALKDE